MKILLVNDDGYTHPHFIKTKEVLEKYADVYVSAPLTQRSGASMSINMENKFPIEIIDDKSIAVASTPADCVSTGLFYFHDVKFDLVVSGTNDGYNASYDTLFSGTLGATLVARMSGIKAIALSADFNEANIEEKIDEAISFIFKNHLMDYADILSVNFPRPKFKKGLGFKIGHIYNEPLSDSVTFKDDMAFSNRVHIDRGVIDDSDYYYVNNGYYSITPISATFEDKKSSSKLEDLINSLDS